MSRADDQVDQQAGNALKKPPASSARSGGRSIHRGIARGRTTANRSERKHHHSDLDGSQRGHMDEYLSVSGGLT